MLGERGGRERIAVCREGHFWENFTWTRKRREVIF